MADTSIKLENAGDCFFFFFRVRRLVGDLGPLVALEMANDESLLPESFELDTLNILCTISIFIIQILAILYILWSVVPLVEHSQQLKLLANVSTPRNNKEREEA